MESTRRFADITALHEVAKAAFGAKRALANVVRIRGGSKKGVYRLTFERGPSAILYVWSAQENFWPGAGPDGPLGAPFVEASGLDLYEAACAELAEIGVRTPGIAYVDRTHQTYPADLAIVDDVGEESLKDLLERGEPAAQASLETLRGYLDRMHKQQGEAIGKVGLSSASQPDGQQSCELIVLVRMLSQLDEAAARLPQVHAEYARLAATAQELAGAVWPRAQHSLVHGELGPDNILIDSQGQPVLIDLEGLMYFDAEWEHAFLDFKLGADYEAVRVPGLDPQRLALYRFALHLSLVVGPLQLLDGDYPERDEMRRVVDWNLEQLLAFHETNTHEMSHDGA